MKSIVKKLEHLFRDRSVIKRDTTSEMYDKTLYGRVAKHYDVTFDIAKEYCEKEGKILLHYCKKDSYLYNRTVKGMNIISRRQKIEKIRDGYKR